MKQTTYARYWGTCPDGTKMSVLALNAKEAKLLIWHKYWTNKEK